MRTRYRSLFILGGLAVIAIAWIASPSRPSAAVATPVATAAGGYQAEVAALDERIAVLKSRVAGMPPSWGEHEWLANAYLDRARLTGVYDDYARASAEIDAAFAIAPAGGGPLVSRASLAFAVHRFDTIAADLAQAERAIALKDTERAHLRALRAQAAYHQGDYTQAEADFAEALKLQLDWSTLCGQALLRANTGDAEAGDRLYVMARRLAVNANPRSIAWLELQRGLLALARGRHAEAEVCYRKADAVFPGWWLIDEHLAEVAALQGRREEARERYRDLIGRTGNPEFMDALAKILRADGEAASAEALTRRSTSAFDQLVAQHPFAATGHALNHFLEHDPQPARAVALAERNHQLRGGGEALTGLIEAYLAAGDGPRAVAAARQLLATRWDTADGHAAASRALAGSDVAAARRSAQRARALNPLIEVETARLDQVH